MKYSRRSRRFVRQKSTLVKTRRRFFSIKFFHTLPSRIHYKTSTICLKKHIHTQMRINIQPFVDGLRKFSQNTTRIKTMKSRFCVQSHDSVRVSSAPFLAKFFLQFHPLLRLSLQQKRDQEIPELIYCYIFVVYVWIITIKRLNWGNSLVEFSHFSARVYPGKRDREKLLSRDVDVEKTPVICIIDWAIFKRQL